MMAECWINAGLVGQKRTFEKLAQPASQGSHVVEQLGLASRAFMSIVRPSFDSQSGGTTCGSPALHFPTCVVVVLRPRQTRHHTKKL